MSASTPSAAFHHVGNDPRAPGLRLWEAVVIFSRRTSPRILAGTVLWFSAVRLIVGGFTWWDLVVPLAAVLLHPLTEWFIHVVILHWRPRKLGSITLDTLLASEHRAHHENPHDERHWFIPTRSELLGLAFVAVMGWLVMPTTGLWLTLVATTQIIGLVYEWTHYLSHTSYRPRGRFYKSIWRHHRLHHFKNEHYWMGVTLHMGDRLLGTMPDPKTVETSPTCRKLHG